MLVPLRVSKVNYDSPKCSVFDAASSTNKTCFGICPVSRLLRIVDCLILDWPAYRQSDRKVVVVEIQRYSNRFVGINGQFLMVCM